MAIFKILLGWKLGDSKPFGLGVPNHRFTRLGQLILVGQKKWQVVRTNNVNNFIMYNSCSMHNCIKKYNKKYIFSDGTDPVPLTKSKMDLNIQQMTNHSPYPGTKLHEITPFPTGSSIHYQIIIPFMKTLSHQYDDAWTSNACNGLNFQYKRQEIFRHCTQYHNDYE